MLHKYLLVFASVCSLWLPVAAQAEKWPDKPVTFIVPFPAGGSMDTFSRPVAKKLGEYLGVPVIISNRAGAGGGVGLSARSEEHTSELQSLMHISYAVFCLKKKNKKEKYN